MQLDRLFSFSSTLPYMRAAQPAAAQRQDKETVVDTTATVTEVVDINGPAAVVRRLMGDLDIRSLSPRQMSEASLDLYVAGILPWDEYAMLAFQPELHPDYDDTIGALTGEPAAPDDPRDFLVQWEERLDFDRRYNPDDEETLARTERIVGLFRQIDRPTDLLV
jgi:hypothetical protein